MGPDPDRESRSSYHLTRRDQQALAILERSPKSGLGMLWGRITFQLWVVWGARLAISAGLIVGLAAMVTMWETMSTHIVVALGAEIVLTGGALLVAHGLRLWWAWRLVRGGPQAGEH